MKLLRAPTAIFLVLFLFFASQTYAQTLVCTSCIPTAAVQDNAITPDKVLASGQTDENCLTYEASGDTWEWQSCGGGSGDVGAVGPGCASGDCWTNGVTTTGSVLLQWEGSGAADANDFVINVPSNPTASIAWTISDAATALTFPTGTDTVVARAATESLTNKTVVIGGTTSEGTGFLNFTAVGASAGCSSGEYWVQANSGNSSLDFCDNGTLRRLTDMQRFTMPLYTAGAVRWEWTNQPTAATFLYGSSDHVVKLDTSGYTAARLTANVATAGDGSSQLELQYKTSACTTLSGYATAGSSAITASMSATGLNTGGWQNLVAGAKGTDICFAAVGTAAGSTGDPVLGTVTVEFR